MRVHNVYGRIQAQNTELCSDFIKRGHATHEDCHRNVCHDKIFVDEHDDHQKGKIHFWVKKRLCIIVCAMTPSRWCWRTPTGKYSLITTATHHLMNPDKALSSFLWSQMKASREPCWDQLFGRRQWHRVEAKDISRFSVCFFAWIFISSLWTTSKPTAIKRMSGWSTNAVQLGRILKIH